MMILAVDTATASCSVALLEGPRLLTEVIHTSGKTHTRHVMPLVQQVLAHCGKGPKEIGGIAVTKGPGTFTGLRIGLSMAKGIAAAVGASIVGISSLAALAYPLRRVSCPVVPMVDARRGEVYYSIYNDKRREPKATAAVGVSPPDQIVDHLSPRSLLVGSGALAYRNLFVGCGMTLADPVHHVIRASSVGLLALRRFDRNDVDELETVVPDYIRKSDAQVQMLKKN